MSGDDYERALERARALVQQRYEPERAAWEMHNQFGFDLELSRRALSAVADEKANDRGRLYKRGAVVALAAVLAGWGLDQWLGASRGIGAALLIFAGLIVVYMMSWLLHETRNI
jgi:hypothetical protein